MAKRKAPPPRSTPRRGEPAQPPAPLTTVGIGASAGGVEALIELFAALPPDTGQAYIVVQHLDPTRESHMREILARHTAMPVSPVEHGAEIAADRVYLILPDSTLTLRDGRFHLARPTAARGFRHPIDAFFHSLADDRRERAVAVVLSGTGTNGSAGIRSIKARGGLVLAQDPETAGFSGMPEAAIATGMVDAVLAPRAIAERLRALPRVFAPDRPESGEGEERETSAGPEMARILGLLRARTGHDFHPYRKGTLSRRIARRMALHGLASLDDYLEALRNDRIEVKALARDLLINVTRFFRDPEAWEALRERVVQPLVERSSGGEIRGWVPACATGQEAYSLALLLADEIERQGTACTVKVFATDTAVEAIDTARAGIYPEGMVADLPPRLLKRHFERRDGAYRVHGAVREMLVFAPHNVLQDPPFSRLDLVSCRNFLIYLEPAMQRQVVELFHFALRDGGHLFLGSAETIGREEHLFHPVTKAESGRIYHRLPATHRTPVELPLIRVPEMKGQQMNPSRPPLNHLAHQVLSQRFAPPAVLIDRRLRVLYFHGPTEQFLSQPAGEPTRELLELAREPLRSRLRATVQRAIAESRPIRAAATLAGAGQVQRRVELGVTPIDSGDGAGTLLITFERPAGWQAEEVDAAEPAEPAEPVEPAEPEQAGRLEARLVQAQEELRTTVEELEASNEELKASNEEVTSMNEELQSTNEELETSKEELQSLNEELDTVNHQLQSKIVELEAATGDMANLLNSTHIPTLFLDRELRIRRYTPATGELLDLLPTDLGRPLSNLARKFDDPGLEDGVAGVLRTFVPSEQEVAADSGRWYLRRVLPYRTEDDRVDGAVVTFLDITERRRAEDRLRALNEQLEREVAERTRYVLLLQHAAVIANQARSVNEAILQTLEQVCELTGWEAGTAHLAGSNGRPGRPDHVYLCGDDAPEAARAAIAAGSPRQRRLVERVIAADAAEWSTAGSEPADARAIIGFPVPHDREVVAVLMFYARRQIEPSDELLEVMVHVGTQLGRVFERRDLEQTIVQLTEGQHQRLGEQLHDVLGQQVAALVMLAKALERKLATAGSPEAEAAERLTAAARTADSQLRDLVRGLVPPPLGGSGLREAIEQLVAHAEETWGLRVDLKLPRRLSVGDELTATALYRILGEALHNVAKHGSDSRAEVSIRVGRDRLTLKVRDGGNGFDGDSPAEGLGLRLMRHRAALIGATLRVDSKLGKSTTVVCELPLGGGDAV